MYFLVIIVCVSRNRLRCCYWKTHTQLLATGNEKKKKRSSNNAHKPFQTETYSIHCDRFTNVYNLGTMYSTFRLRIEQQQIIDLRP